MRLANRRQHPFAVFIASALLFVAACGGADSDPDRDSPGIDAGTDALGTDVISGDAGEDATNRPITVRGRVLDSPTIGLPDIRVGLMDGRVTVTDDDGYFEFDNVATPYNIVAFQLRGDRHGSMYVGLTRPDPHLYLLGSNTYGGDSSRIIGTVTGGLFDASNPPPLRTAVTFAADPSEPAVESNYTRTSIAGDYSLRLNWLGGDTISGRLYALQWELGADSEPIRFTRLGSAPVTINRGDELVNVEIPLTRDVETTTLAGEVKIDPDYEFSSVSAVAVLDDRASLTPYGQSDSASFSFKFPKADGLTRALRASAMLPNRGGSPNLSRVQRIPDDQTEPFVLRLYGGPRLESPLDNASGIDTGTTFRWSEFPNGIHRVTIRPKNGSGPILVVRTAENTFTLPDLRAIGYELARDTEYSWSVRGIGPAATIDDAASPWFGTITNLVAFLRPRLQEVFANDGIFASASEFHSFTSPAD